MPRGQNVQPPPKLGPAQAEPQPAGAPRRKHPLLLALVAAAFLGWLGFLVWMAAFA